MNLKIRHLVAALAVLGGFALGSVSLAAAQEDGTTTTTEGTTDSTDSTDPATDDSTDDTTDDSTDDSTAPDHDCPLDDGTAPASGDGSTEVPSSARGQI